MSDQDDQETTDACRAGGDHHPNPPQIERGAVVIRCGKCGDVVG